MRKNRVKRNWKQYAKHLKKNKKNDAINRKENVLSKYNIIRNWKRERE